jgi:hypothetical protein
MRRLCSPLSELIGLAVFPFFGVVVLLWAIGTQAIVVPSGSAIAPYGLVMCPFVSIVVLLLAMGTQAAIAPFATYEQVFQYSDGSISTNQTAQFYLSDALPGGVIQVGGHTLQIQALPPKLRYKTREVARIPKSVSLHTEEVYLAMGDGQPGVAATDRTLQGRTARRLLQTTVPLNDDPSTIHFATSMEYDEYHYITAPDSCSTATVEDWQFTTGKYFDGSYKIDVVSTLVPQEKALQHLADLEAALRADPDQAISNSFYLRQITDDTASFTATVTSFTPQQQAPFYAPFGWLNPYFAMLHTDNFVKYAKNVLNAQWMKTSLTTSENLLLRAVTCESFPGYCFARDMSYVSGGAVYSFSGDCNLYKKSALTMSQNFEHSSAYNLANGLASPLGTYFEKQLQTLNSSFLSLISLNDANSGWAGSVGIALKAVNASLYAQGGINSKVEQLFRDQNGINARVITAEGKISDAIDFISSASKNVTATLISGLQAESNRVDLLNSGITNSTNFKFALLIGSLKNMSDSSDAKFMQMYRNIQDLSGLLQSTSAQFTSFVQQKQFNRVLTRQFYRSIDVLAVSGSEEIPLVSGTGIRPATLTGLQLKALVDTVIVTSGIGSVHAVRLDFFVDTYVMLNASRPWTTIEQLVVWAGVAPCVIRANVAASSAFNDTTIYCTLWAEVTSMDCASGYIPQSNTCSGTNTTTSTTLTTSTVLFSFFSSLCLQSPVFTVASVSLSTASRVYPVATTCGSTFQEKMIAVDRSMDPVLVALTYVWTSYMQTFQATLQSLELLAYGQLPNGVHTEPTSMGYSPGPISGVDGSRVSLQGMRAYWLSVHPATLPVTALTFVSESTGTQEVTVSLKSSPACATNGNITSTCYSVRNSDLRTNWVFKDQTGIALPPQMVVVGDITSPSFSAIYDVPLALIETTSNTLVRENLLTYLMMPAGTETTSDFSHFDRISHGLFSSRSGSASASDYQFPAVFDSEGYPVCNIDGGLPVSSTYIAPVDNCVAPFVTSVPFFTGSYAYYGAPPVAPSGGVCSIAPPSSSQLNSVVLLYSQEARVPDANGTLIFPPGASLSVSWSTQVEWSFSLWVNVLRSPAGQIGVTLWSGQLIIQGTSHTLDLRWGSCKSPQSDSGVLYMCVDAPNGYSVKVTTVDYGSCVTGSCKYPDTQLNSWSFLAFTVSPTKALAYTNGVLTYFSKDSKPQSITSTFWNTGSLVSLPVTTVSDVFLVRSLKFYSWALTKQDIDTEMRCGQMTIVPRCWLPASQSVGTNLSWVPSSALQIADTSTPVMRLHELRPSCLGRSSGTLVSVSRAYDALHPIVFSSTVAHPIVFSWAATLALPAFTVSFWMRRLVDLGSLVYSDGAAIFVSTKLVFSPGIPQQTLTLTLKRSSTLCVAYSWVSSLPAATFNVGVYSSLIAEPTSHHYSMSVSGQSASLYLDGILQGFVGNTTCSVDVQTIINLSPGCADLSSYLSGYSDMDCTSAQLVRVYSGALSGYEIQEATACERSSFSVGNSTALYEFPLAVCTLPAADAKVGYCRHEMMCHGHCAAYSVITMDRFTPLQIVCDSGWLPPTCVTRCARVDVFGECITQTQLSTVSVDLVADAFSPNGYWCMALKYFQAGAVSIGGQSFVDFSYRQYEYLTDLTIPSGQIVSIVPAGKCPAVVLQQNGDASVWVVLTNVYDGYTQLLIHVQNIGACGAPSICCDHTYPLTLAPLSVYNWNLPSLCSSMQIEILLDFGNSQSLCQTRNATTVASQLAASVSAPVVANVARSIVVTGNEVLTSMAEINQRIVQFQIAIVNATYEAAMRGLNVRDILDATSKAIFDTPATTLPAAPVLTNPFDDRRLKEILTNLTNAIDDAAKANGNQANDLLTLVSLGAQFNALATSVSNTVSQQQIKLDIFQHQVNLTNGVLLNSLGQMRIALDAFNAAIPSQVESQISSSGAGNISTIALVFLSLGSVVGALAGCWITWQYRDDISSVLSHMFRFHPRHRRRVDMQSDDEGSQFADEQDVNSELPSPSPEPMAQSTVNARALSRESNRMTHPHLFG